MHRILLVGATKRERKQPSLLERLFPVSFSLGALDLDFAAGFVALFAEPRSPFRSRGPIFSFSSLSRVCHVLSRVKKQNTTKRKNVVCRFLFFFGSARKTATQLAHFVTFFRFHRMLFGG